MLRKTILFLLFVLQFPLVFFFWSSSSGHLLAENAGFKLVAIGRLAGLFAVLFTLLQLALLSRPRWIESVFGLDKLTRIHHLNGFLALFFILLHPLLLNAGYSANNGISPLDQLLLFLGWEDVTAALAAQLILAAIVILSVYKVKKRLPYEIWYGIHLLTYLAVFLAWGHQMKVGADFINNPALIFYWYGLYGFIVFLVLIRFLRPIFLWQRCRFRVEKIVKESPVAKSVYITGKNISDFRIKPGQFMIFRFLDKERWWQAHPFSLSQAVRRNSFRITVKNSGDFSGRIDGIKSGTSVVVDGPYGIFTLEKAKGKKLLFIAAGAGITPIKSLIEEGSAAKRNMILLYFNRMIGETIFKDELDRLSKRKLLTAHYPYTRESKIRGPRGRISRQLLEQLVPDIHSRHVFICGPSAMLKATRRILQEAGVPARQVSFEEFSL